MAEDDRLDVAQRESQPAHVLDDAARRDAGVEQQGALSPVLLDPYERGEAGLGDERVRNAVGHERCHDARRASGKRLRPAKPRDRTLVGDQRIRDVVHQDRHADAVDRLELDHVRHGDDPK